MKTEKKILIAFILNLGFSIFEFIGGIYTGSIAIISDALHDIGDSASIGLSFFLEKKSKKQPDDKFTYGYLRYSVLGSLITTMILLIGSVIVIYNAICRIISPVEIKYNEVIIFAVLGVCINFLAAFFTHSGDSLNQKAVNLHMLEDVLGWNVVLIGAVIMRFTNCMIIDPVLSIGVAIFILAIAIKNLKKIVDIFLLKTPHAVSVIEVKEHVKNLDEVIDVHHVHIWSIDGQRNYATLHIVTNADAHETREKVRKKLHKLGICHVTLELEENGECCHEKQCKIEIKENKCHHHH